MLLYVVYLQRIDKATSRSRLGVVAFRKVVTEFTQLARFDVPIIWLIYLEQTVLVVGCVPFDFILEQYLVFDDALEDFELLEKFIDSEFFFHSFLSFGNFERLLVNP